MLGLNSPYDLTYPCVLIVDTPKKIKELSNSTLEINGEFFDIKNMHEYPYKLEGTILNGIEDLFILPSTSVRVPRYIIDTKKAKIFKLKKELFYKIEYRKILLSTYSYLYVEGLTFQIEHYDYFLRQEGVNRISTLYSKLALFNSMFYHLNTNYTNSHEKRKTNYL